MTKPGKLRISILHPDEGMSPMACREWLRSEAASIQVNAGEYDIIVIRLFLPVRMITTLSQRKIDMLLSEIVNKHQNILRVDLRPVATNLSRDEMVRAADEARHDIEVMLKDLPPPSTLH